MLRIKNHVDEARAGSYAGHPARRGVRQGPSGVGNWCLWGVVATEFVDSVVRV